MSPRGQKGLRNMTEMGMPFCILQRMQFPRSLPENDSVRVREIGRGKCWQGWRVGGGWGDLGRNSGGDGITTNGCMSLSFYKEYSSFDLRPLKPIVNFWPPERQRMCVALSREVLVMYFGSHGSKFELSCYLPCYFLAWRTTSVREGEF